MRDNTHWVGTWTAAPAPAEGAAFSNHTLRMIPRVSIGGSTLRVRISNAYGTRPLAIGAACVGLRSTGPALVPGSNRRLTFGGEARRDDRRRRAGRQRSGRAGVRAVVGPCRQRAPAGRSAGELRDHRALCAADQLHLAAGRFRRRRGHAGRPPHRRLVLRLRHRCRRAAGDGRHRRGRRLADRRQHLDP